MKIAVFMEDAAQAQFLQTLMRRFLPVALQDIEIIERNRTGGAGATLTALRSYLRDVQAPGMFAEVVVAAVDGNCHGRQERVKQVRTIATRSKYAGQLVCAVPDPHIEIWYLADNRAAAAVAGVKRQRAVPQYKCERRRYKQLLREVFLCGGIDPPAGGSEYGDEIARRLDLDVAARNQPSFDAFRKDFTAAVRAAAATT